MPADVNWPIRIIGSIALIGLFIYFYIPLSHDVACLTSTGRTANAGAVILLSLIFLLGPTAIGAIACVYKPIKGIFANKKLIAQLEKSIQKGEDR